MPIWARGTFAGPVSSRYFSECRFSIFNLCTRCVYYLLMRIRSVGSHSRDQAECFRYFVSLNIGSMLSSIVFPSSFFTSSRVLFSNRRPNLQHKSTGTKVASLLHESFTVIHSSPDRYIASSELSQQLFPHTRTLTAALEHVQPHNQIAKYRLKPTAAMACQH